MVGSDSMSIPSFGLWQDWTVLSWVLLRAAPLDIVVTVEQANANSLYRLGSACGAKCQSFEEVA